jgi:Uma2 family endonuclease
MSAMTGPVRIKAATPGVKLTYDDLAAMVPEDDLLRHELIDGEHYVSASPNTAHQRVIGNLYFLVRTYLEQHRIGQVFVPRFDVVFTPFDAVEPDLMYMSKERSAAILTEKHVKGAPELVVEVKSPSTGKYDETLKRRLYEREGVSEYWIVDPHTEVVRVYRRADRGFARAIELSHEAGDVLTTPLLPELKLRLADVFKD